jgi:hypothetical protein
LKLQGNRAE